MSFKEAHLRLQSFPPPPDWYCVLRRLQHCLPSPKPIKLGLQSWRGGNPHKKKAALKPVDKFMWLLFRQGQCFDCSPRPFHPFHCAEVGGGGQE